MSKKPFVYTGCENLEVMSEAVRYNDFLIAQVLYSISLSSKKKPRILDFGAGSGTYSLILRDKGVQTECLEPDKILTKVLKSKGFTVYTNVKDVKQKFDVIFSLNVMEHVGDDRTSFKEQYDILNPGGIILVYVPAFQLLYSSMDKKVEHVRRYRKSELREKVSAAGFKILDIRYCDPIGFPASLAYKAFGNKKGDLNPSAISIYDKYFFPASVFLEPVTKNFFGKNVLLVGRK